MTATTTMTNAAIFLSNGISTASAVDYKPFRRIVRQFVNEKISRERFVFDWQEEQCEQRLSVARRTVCV